MFHEFPKCLYHGGDVEAAYCVVLDASAQESAQADGFMPAGESQEKAKRAYTRKPKADE